MRILFTVERFYPCIGGAEEVVRRVAEGLLKKGHEVTVATSFSTQRRSDELSGIKIQSFKISGNKVKGIRGEKKKYQEFLLESKFEIIVNYAAQTWTTDLTFDFLDKIMGVKVLMPCGYSGLALWSKRLLYWNYFKKLPYYLKKYDHIIYHHSNYIDKAFGDRHGIKHYSIIPNGIDINEMQNHAIKFREHYNINTKYMLLNVSNHYKLKGHSFFLDSFKLLNRDDVTLVIIGNRVSGIKGCYNKCVKVASKKGNILLLENLQREYVISAFAESDIFVFGSEVECFPLVILEAMSIGLPFISTNVGCVKELKGGIIVSNPMEMAVYINDLLNQSNLRKELGEMGKIECLKKYTWDKIIPQYERLFINLAR